MAMHLFIKVAWPFFIELCVKRKKEPANFKPGSFGKDKEA